MRRSLLTFLIFIFIIPVIASAAARPESYMEVTVVKGDYLITICQRYLDHPQEWRHIAKINRIKNPDVIFPGRILRIPVEMLRGVPIEGEVQFVRGNAEVQVKKGEEWKKLSVNDRIPEGSTVRTRKESEIGIGFKNGVFWDQRANSTVKVTSARRKGDFDLHKLFLSIGKTITTIRKATGKEYRFEIDTPSAVSAARGTEFRTGVDEYEATRSEVLEGQINIEARNQILSIAEGEGVLVRKGERPLPPVKLLPRPQVLNMHPIYKKLPVELAFKKIENAVSYRVVLARDMELRDVLKEAMIRPEDAFTLSQLDDGTYYLQTESIDSQGLEGLPSTPIEINIRVHPVPPSILTPVEGGEYRNKTLRCKWLKVEDAVAYHLQIAEDEKFDKIIDDRPDIQDTGYKIEGPDYKEYYFRISSVAKDRFEGEWSDAVKFKFIPPPPTPEVGRPEMSEHEIQIRWTDLGPGYSYHFQMSSDQTFSSVLVNKYLKEPAITIKKPQKSGTYYVRTSGVDSSGYEGNFSTAQIFEIKKGKLLLKLLGLSCILSLFLLLL
jgi:hypothetical protein